MPLPLTLHPVTNERQMGTRTVTLDCLTGGLRIGTGTLSLALAAQAFWLEFGGTVAVEC